MGSGRGPPDWRDYRTVCIVDVHGGDAGSGGSARLGRPTVEGAIVTPDARYYENDMPTSSEERRRTEAALVRAIDANPDVASSETYSAVCAFVDVLLDDGLLPEAVVIAFKSALARAESLHRFEADTREQIRSALVSACIQHYFSRRVADDVRLTRPSALRLVREDEGPTLHAPDATA